MAALKVYKNSYNIRISTTPFTILQGMLPPVSRKKRHDAYCEPPSLLDKFLSNIRCLTPRLKARIGMTPVQAHHGKKGLTN